MKKSYYGNVCQIIAFYNKFDMIKLHDSDFMNIRSLNPAVDRKYLLLIAGLLWAVIAILLISYAAGWLAQYNGNPIPFYSAGFLLALPAHRFGFLKIASRNIERIMPQKEKHCIFSFLTWRSYGTILIMMPLGIILRHSRFPKEYLAVVYLTIGIALFLSGIRYFRNSIALILNRNPQ